MSKNLLQKITPNGEDIKNIGVNMMAAWLAGNAANIISNSVFHYDLNRYNSVDHLVMGVGLGTLAYRKAGGGCKGLAAGLLAGTLFSAAWEPLENSYVWKGSILNMDTLSDVAVVYAGNILGFVGEKLKRCKGKKKDK